MQSRSLLPATAFNVSNMSTAGIEEVIMRIVPNYDPSNEEMKQFYIELLRCWTALGYVAWPMSSCASMPVCQWKLVCVSSCRTALQ